MRPSLGDQWGTSWLVELTPEEMNLLADWLFRGTLAFFIAGLIILGMLTVFCDKSAAHNVGTDDIPGVYWERVSCEKFE